jgi:hypothetical protein
LTAELNILLVLVAIPKLKFACEMQPALTEPAGGVLLLAFQPEALRYSLQFVLLSALMLAKAFEMFKSYCFRQKHYNLYQNSNAVRFMLQIRENMRFNDIGINYVYIYKLKNGAIVS